MAPVRAGEGFVMRAGLAILCVALAGLAGSARADVYLSFEHWSGQWSDPEKSPATDQDDDLCWAAAAAGVLDWTGWGRLAGLADADAGFRYFQDRWTNAGGLPSFAWQWWFEGDNPADGWPGWAQVDGPGGALLAGTVDFDAIYHHGWSDAEALADLDRFLRAGYGVALLLTNDTVSHAVNVWGVQSDAGDYQGIWITDSDDDRHRLDPPDVLSFQSVSLSDGRWYLGDYLDGQWFINEVQALDRSPLLEVRVPEPTALALLAGGLLTLRRRARP